MGMDVKRDPKILRRKKIRNSIIIGLLAVAATAATFFVSRLKPAAPTVARSTVWTGVVKRGAFVREVRGAGTLVPEDIRWVSHLDGEAAGRAELAASLDHDGAVAEREPADPAADPLLATELLVARMEGEHVAVTVVPGVADLDLVLVPRHALAERPV